MADTRMYQGSVRVDDAGLRELFERVFDRTRNIASAVTNRFLLDDGGLAEFQLDQITVPTLVMHGTEDPLFPYAHGEALVRAIPEPG